MSDWIEVVERARSLDGDLTAWLAGLLGEGNGAVALAVRVTGGQARVEAAAAAGGPPDLVEVAVASNHQGSARSVELVYRSGFVAAALSEVFGEESEEMAPLAETSGGHFRDTIGIVAHASPGRAVSLSSPLTQLGRLAPGERRRWVQVASHVGAGLRLRTTVSSLGLDHPSVEADAKAAGSVLWLSGKRLHWSGSISVSSFVASPSGTARSPEAFPVVTSPGAKWREMSD